MTLRDVYAASVIALFVLVAVTVLVAIRQRSFRGFTTADLATLALLVCLLYVAAIPWQIGLAKVPGLDALVFSIPYTAVLLIGLRLVPKPGAATVLVFGARRADRPLARRLHCCQGGTNSSFDHRINNDANLTQGSTAAMSRLLDLSNEGYISGLYQDDPSYRIIFVRQNLEDRRRSRRTTAERIPLPPVSEHPRSVKSRVEPRH